MTPAPGRDPQICRTLNGRPLDEITLEAAAHGDLSPVDLHVHPEALRHQAGVAEGHGNPQLGDDLRHAAELTALADGDTLGIYEALRPGRSTLTALPSLAGRLEEADAPPCAALVREAAAVYERRGLLAPG